MFSTIFPPQIGGPATQCLNLCKALVTRGEVPIVVTYGTNFGLNEDNGFRVYTFRVRYTHTPLDKVLRWLFFSPYILFILKKERIDVLHCHSVSALSFVAALIAKALGIPRVIKFAGDWVWETLSTYKVQAKDFNEIYKKHFYARFMTSIEKFGLNLFNRIWVVSNFRRQNIKDLLGTDKKVFFVNNCLLLRGGGSRKWNANDPVVLISANRFIPHKRVAFIVELFRESKIPNSSLVLIGGGAPQEVGKVRDAIKQFNLEDRVALKGVLTSKEVYEEFGKASFYISTSLEEGLPNVFIEAMHYGLPIVTSDAGGSREMVIDNETGFVVGVDDKQGFIEKIQKLGADPALRTKMSKNAYKRSKLFNLDDKIDEFISMYRGLLK